MVYCHRDQTCRHRPFTPPTVAPDERLWDSEWLRELLEDKGQGSTLEIPILWAGRGYPGLGQREASFEAAAWLCKLHALLDLSRRHFPFRRNRMRTVVTLDPSIHSLCTLPLPLVPRPGVV